MILGLACMLAAGIYGTCTAAKRIFSVQVVPALLASTRSAPISTPIAAVSNRSFHHTPT
jgi:hypothetical protein